MNELTVEPAQRFKVAIRNRAASATYRVTHDWVLSPETGYKPSAGALHNQYDLWRPTNNMLHGSVQCEELLRRAIEVVGVREESQLPEKVAAYRTLLESGSCPEWRNTAEYAVGSALEVKLSPDFTLYPGDELRITVERLEAESRSPLKSWRFVVRPAPPPPLEWKYENEEAWIVGETTRDMAEMIVFARRTALPRDGELRHSVRLARDAAGSSAPSFTVSLAVVPGAPREYALAFADHIWSPAMYEPLATTLMQALDLRAAPSSQDCRILEALMDPQSVVLERESQRVSRRLEQAMLDAGAHEQAAIVLGTLALREAPDGLADIRQTLCRMAAHLAVARALRRRDSSLLGDLADAMLLTLIQRQTDALARIQVLEKARPTAAYAAFLRALRVRNTRDWRVISDPARASLIERLEQFRAVNSSLGSSLALEFLDSFEAEPISDWGRIGFEGEWSVEEAHRFGDQRLTLELEDVASTWRASHGTPLLKRTPSQALNALPERLLSVDPAGRAHPRVLGWGVWACFFQRNLRLESRMATEAYGHWLGLPEQSQQIQAEAKEALSALDLWPSLALQWLANPELAGTTATPAAAEGVAVTTWREACSRGVELVRRAPERVAAGTWRLLGQNCAAERDRRTLPAASRWFNALTPRGTALYDADRLLVVDLDASKEKEIYATLRERAPFNLAIVALSAPRGPDPPFEELAALYGPVADYDLGVMKWLAKARRRDPAGFTALFEKAASIEPENYLELGDYLVDVDRDDEAAAAYEKAIARARDRVAVSSNVRWLVGYYCNRGRTERAREVAQMAADVYSARGLQAMGYFMERMGQPAEAARWYQKIAERYENTNFALEKFYIRHEQRFADGRFRDEAATALTSLFPLGLERVTLPELTTPPDVGQAVQLSGDAQQEAFGLLKDDVVVSVNGYRVRNVDQYTCVWTFDDKLEGTAIVWRKDRYLEVTGPMKRLRYDPISRPI